MSTGNFEILCTEGASPGGEGLDAHALQKGTIRLRQSLNRDEIVSLCAELRAFLNRGCHVWELALEEVETCGPELLGLFLGTHAMIRTRSGKLTLRVSPGSEIAEGLRVSRLCRVLAIDAAA